MTSSPASARQISTPNELPVICSIPYMDLLAGRPAENGGWTRLSDLCDLETGKLHAAMQAMASVRKYPPDDGRTLGSSLVLITANAVFPFLELIAAGRGALRMPVTETWWRTVPSANVKAIAVESVRFTPVPPFHAAGPDDFATIRTLLREAMDPLYEATCRLTRVPVRAQWALTESSIGGWLMSKYPGQGGEAAAAIADELFSDGDVLWRSRPRFWSFQANGTTHTAFTRRVCCYNFNKLEKKDPDDGYCGSMCPLIPPPQRIQNAIANVTDVPQSGP
jgi:hypothetical protein